MTNQDIASVLSQVEKGEITADEGTALLARSNARKLRGVEAVPAAHVKAFETLYETGDYRQFVISLGSNFNTNTAQAYIGRIVRFMSQSKGE